MHTKPAIDSARAAPALPPPSAGHDAAIESTFEPEARQFMRDITSSLMPRLGQSPERWIVYRLRRNDVRSCPVHGTVRLMALLSRVAGCRRPEAHTHREGYKRKRPPRERKPFHHHPQPAEEI